MLAVQLSSTVIKSILSFKFHAPLRLVWTCTISFLLLLFGVNSGFRAIRKINQHILSIISHAFKGYVLCIFIFMFLLFASASKIMKNVFYFILISSFLLEISRFLYVFFLRGTYLLTDMMEIMKEKS